MTFNDRLLVLRQESGLDQKGCAAALGVDNSKYNKWENGKNRPDYETVCSIADHYGVTTDYLLGRSDAKHPENTALVTELGLSDEAIEAIKELRIGDHPQYALYMYLKDRPPKLIDQSCDRRSLLDVFNAVLHASLFEHLLNIIRTLTSPINERAGYAQWEDDGHASLIPLTPSFDDPYKSMLQEALDRIVQAVKKEALTGRFDEKQVDMYKGKMDSEGGE